MRINATTLFVIATAIWGSTWLGIKYQLGVVAPEVSVAYRFGLAALLLALWCMSTGRSLRFPLREHAWLVALGALLFGFNYVGVYWAERYVASGLVAVLFATLVFLNQIGMRLVYGVPLRARTIVAAVIGVTGVALLFLPELKLAQGGGSAAYGIAFGLGATALASGGNMVAIRNQRAGIPTMAGNAWGMAYGALVAAAIAVAEGVPWTFDPRPGYIISLAYLSVFGSIIAFWAYLTLIRRVGPGPAAYTSISTPVVALALSTLFEGYQWTWIAVCGVALAVAGTWLATKSPDPQPAR